MPDQMRSDPPAAIDPAHARLPSAAELLLLQIRYQARLLLANGRAMVIGVGLPVILLITSANSHGHVSRSSVAGRAVFGLTLTAWNTYGIRLVAAREAGILKRWRATPLPRSCYFAARIIATTLVSVLAGAVTVVVAVILYHTHLTAGSALGLLIVFVLSAAAWAAAATALTTAVSTVESASPVFILIYFPVVIISGVLGTINEPGWLHTLARYLPAQPSIHAATSVLRHAPGAPLVPAHDVIVLAAWAVIGIAVALPTFRWEPHRPAQRRAARSAA
jgi:ABC-2 type transport system permease protein